MGCDIHCFIEFKEQPHHDWTSFGGQIRPGRDYNAFGTLAGVRNENEYEHIEPRGAPADIAYQAAEDFYLYITKDAKAANNEATEERAAEWVRNGYSRLVRDGKWITNPDAHSDTWLTLAEFKAAISRLSYGGSIQFRAMIGAMETLESNGAETRLVFWFDN